MRIHRSPPGLSTMLASPRITRLDTSCGELVPDSIAGPGDNRARLSFADLAAALSPDLPRQDAAFDFPKTEYTAGNARLIFASGATLARVAVCRVTGAVRVLDLHLHSAAGPVIDLGSYLGQMEGGAVQGLGFTLTEEALMEGGRYVTANLDTYAMPTVRDVPLRMQVTALETLDPGDPHGPRGAGELGIGGISPAIANAVADALGHWPAAMPIRVPA